MLKAANTTSAYPTAHAATSVAAVGLADVACPETKALVRAWKASRGWHSMPPMSALAETCAGHDAAYASIAKVVDGGRDYEFEFIGSAHVHAYGVNHQGKRVSDIMQLSPRFGRQLKASYDLVCISGRPHAFQGSIGSDNAQARFVWFETAYLPFGENGSIDFILNAAKYRLREDAL